MLFRKFIMAAILAVTSISPAFSSVDYHVENQQPVVEKALQLEGCVAQPRLKASPSKFLCLQAA